MKIALATICAAIRGPMSWQTLRKAFVQIRRYLYEPPRRRKKQCDYLSERLT